MIDLPQSALEFGCANTLSGVSTSRTFMLSELSALFERCPNEASLSDYQTAIVQENILLKPSATTRQKTYSFLKNRYALDSNVPIFRILRLLWRLSANDRPLLAMLVAVARDPLIQSTVDLILETAPESRLLSTDFSRAIEAGSTKLLAANTLESCGENMTSNWKQSGHLVLARPGGRRQRVHPEIGSATMALLLGHVCGIGGYALLATTWAKLLDASSGDMLNLAQVAGQRGWIEFRHAGNVLDVTFNKLLERGNQSP